MKVVFIALIYTTLLFYPVTMRRTGNPSRVVVSGVHPPTPPFHAFDVCVSRIGFNDPSAQLPGVQRKFAFSKLSRFPQRTEYDYNKKHILAFTGIRTSKLPSTETY